jgi:hypothetical protein
VEPCRDSSATPISITAVSIASKTSIENFSIERLEAPEDVHMERRVLRKIDTRLLPILDALYTIALVDHTNISVARISGQDDNTDLEVGSRASLVSVDVHISIAF